ncbi:hypothetical protein EW026_g1919 [Hermanssonia centrifuga]|uniref:Dienelactone hydrolase domain-containing protein n=1 Tax=Hermanssonia centrifuga TaxID=98765 RepID=A0A4S4KQK0_9APHY|nr:hypothetical protein EW026_g1919 [Hermanssonia centrifuga]
MLLIGVRHEGTPEGKVEQIGGVDCYIATPSVEYPTDKVILYIPDVFGIQLVNHKLQADDFARNGFKVVVPDIFHDAAPPDALDPGSNFNLGEWFTRNGPDYTEPQVRKVVAALKADGITKIGATGYCYGARTAFNLAFENEKYLAEAKAPLLINSCEFDSIFPAEAQKSADEILGDGKFTPGYKRLYWEGCTHGFAVRGDLSDPKIKAGREGSFKATVEWFLKYL